MLCFEISPYEKLMHSNLATQCPGFETSPFSFCVIIEAPPPEMWDGVAICAVTFGGGSHLKAKWDKTIVGTWHVWHRSSAESQVKVTVVQCGDEGSHTRSYRPGHAM